MKAYFANFCIQDDYE
jgi:calcium-dependent protein kinase